jgi:hypothetical protein
MSPSAERRQRRRQLQPFEDKAFAESEKIVNNSNGNRRALSNLTG